MAIDKAPVRCSWVGGGPPMLAYHDKEWGVPVHDDRTLFEFLTLEGAQAGLSWETILKKRENYRRAFDNFDAARIARYSQRDVERLLADAGIVRNRLKIAATVNNAQRTLEVREELGSFEEYIWRVVGGRPIKNSFRAVSEVPAKTEESEAMSAELRRRGFKFIGSTICYAFMQAVGMVNDHTVGCFRHAEV